MFREISAVRYFRRSPMTDFLHLLGGIDLGDFEQVRKTVKNGMRVRAVWKEECQGHILDIRYFEPV
jgi:uncharacterized OB-fold protein